jgi:hypothetical protein
MVAANAISYDDVPLIFVLLGVRSGETIRRPMSGMEAAFHAVRRINMAAVSKTCDPLQLHLSHLFL